MCRCTLMLLLALSSWLPARASFAADSRSKDPPGYSEAVAAGLSELDAGNYPEALEEFIRAHRIFPNARTFRGLGMVEFELRNYPESARRLQEALAASERPLEGKMRADTEALLARAQRYLGELHLEVAPQNAAVTIDGQPVNVAGEGLLMLEVGNHAIEVSAPGRSNEKRSFRIQGGARSDLRIALSTVETAPTNAAESGAASAPKGSSTPPSEVKPTYKKWWLWTTIAIVAAGGATAAALLLTRKTEHEPRAVQTGNAAGPVLQTLGSF